MTGFEPAPEYRPKLRHRICAFLLRRHVGQIEMWAYSQRHRWCWRCVRFTRFLWCENCGKGWYCLRHCEWEDEYGEFGTLLAHYPICPRKECQ